MNNLCSTDTEQIREKGISPEKLQEQLDGFKKGFPFARLIASALKGQGVCSFSAEEIEKYRRIYRDKAQEERIVKFVPASGAATRMFKDLYAYREAIEAGSLTELKPDVAEFFARLPDFAFYEELREAIKRVSGRDLEAFLAEGDHLPVLEALLENEKGLRYGHLPKALLLFHRYPDGPRTALEEHLVEAALYASGNGLCRLHFTISPEHKAAFEVFIDCVLSAYERKYDVRYEISYSEQKPSTDTVAVTLDNEIFRDEDGKIVFRPGGHGALIENLAEVEAEVIFIKNIDNVTTDALRQDTITYKELLAGILIERREAIFSYLRELERMNQTYPAYLQKLRAFVCNRLSLALPDDFDRMGQTARLAYFKQALNRPIRVCGVVKNTGEPGGGPFWMLSQGDKAPSLQIVESSQIDRSDAGQRGIFETAEFFNPVDLVCSIYDYKGRKFDLTEFVDSQTAFISAKSVRGTDIKAMELPGLWNGAMARWITLFVEVPQSVFTPVKTVNDLLRPRHRNEKIGS